MKKREFEMKITCLLFLILCCFSSFAFSKSSPIEMVSVQDDLGKDAKDFFLYMKASYQHYSGDVSGALYSFENLFSQDAPVYAYRDFIKLLFDINQFQKIVGLPEKVQNAFDDDLEIQLIFAQTFLNLNMDQKAEKLFKKLVKKHPDNAQVAYYAAVSYIKNNQLNEAIKFIDEALKRPVLKSKHFLFYFLQSKIYSKLGKNEKALNVIKKSLELYPSFGKGWLFKALLEEQLGKINDAIKGYENFLDIVGRDLAVEKQLIHLLFSAQRFQEAADVLKNIKVDSPAYYFDLALIEWKAESYKSALQNVEKAIEKLPDFKKARLLKIEILLAQGLKREVLDFTQGWLKRAPNDNSVVAVLLLLRRQQGVSKDAIVKIFENVAEESAGGEGIFSALVDLYLEDANYSLALKYCKKLFDITKDDGLKSKILFQVGYIHFVRKDFDKVEEPLKRAITLKPTHPSAYNLLAYFYAQTNKRLNYALTLSSQALMVAPDRYYYLDTQGYILLKLGRAQESIKYFEKALELSKLGMGKNSKMLQVGEQNEEIVQHLEEAKKALEKNR